MKNVLSALKLAMDFDHQGEWERAHGIVQDIRHELAYRIHAYLHRKEGDMESALYWYRYIGVEPFRGRFLTEQKYIMKQLKDQS